MDRRWWWIPGLLFAGGLAFGIDLPVSRWLHTHQHWKVLHSPLQVVEALADGAGVALLLITLWIVTPIRRREIPRAALTVISGGLLANVFKLLLVRIRPQSFPDLTQVTSIRETFAGWLSITWTAEDLATQAIVPLKSLSQIQSFPSGHTATGAALAVAMTRLFPQGGWWFAVLTALIALQRVETGAHYVSDTCCGAAVGLLAALSWQQGTPWARALDRYERVRSETDQRDPPAATTTPHSST